MKPENISPLDVKTAFLRFDADQVLNRYWELAMLTSEETKGNITGQLKALDALREEQTKAPGAPAKELPAPQVYRAEWLAKS